MKRSVLIMAMVAGALLLLANYRLTAQSGATGQPGPPAQPGQRGSPGATDAEIRELVEALDRGRAAWINGAAETSATTRMVQAPDMFIFPPFGGTRPAAGPALIEAQRNTAAQFKGGTGKIELIKAMSSGDMLVLVLLETNEVNFAGQTKPQPWILRTTQVFQRDGNRWVRLHRHADPLVKQRSLAETLALY